MLILAILAVIVFLGTVFLVYVFVSLCRDSRKGRAIVFVEVLDEPRILSQDTHQPQLLFHRPTDRDRGEVNQANARADSSRRRAESYLATLPSVLRAGSK
jgi:hypothetical protein